MRCRPPQQVQELQRLLIAQRLLTGEADGRLGAQTRTAVKQAQLKVGLPADAYPTPELIERLRRLIAARVGIVMMRAVNISLNHILPQWV